QKSFHSINLKTLTIFPGEHGGCSFGKFANKIFFYFTTSRSKVNVVFPWKNLNGRIYPMTFFLHNTNCLTPVIRPIMHIFLTGPMATSPFFIPESFGEKDIPPDVRELLNNLTHQFP